MKMTERQSFILFTQLKKKPHGAHIKKQMSNLTLKVYDIKDIGNI